MTETVKMCQNGQKSVFEFDLLAPFTTTKYGFCCGKEPFSICPVKDCYVTDDRNYLEDVSKYDVIQFHQRSTYHWDLPKKRSPHQRYIMWYMESAANPYGFVR